MLLENLWACVEPQQRHSANLLHLPGEASSSRIVYLCCHLDNNYPDLRITRPTSFCCHFTFLRVCNHLFFFLLISESASKRVLPASPQNRLRSHPGNTSQSASQEISESDSHPVQTKATYTQLKSSPLKAIKQQACLHPTIAKKPRCSPKKSKRLSKKHKAEEACMDLGSSKVSLEKVLALFTPMLPCISPLPDMVRIHLCLMQIRFLNIFFTCGCPCVYLGRQDAVFFLNFFNIICYLHNAIIIMILKINK